MNWMTCCQRKYLLKTGGVIHFGILKFFLRFNRFSRLKQVINSHPIMLFMKGSSDVRNDSLF